MTSARSLTSSIISRAESFEDIRAGVARLADVQDAPSHHTHRARLQDKSEDAAQRRSDPLGRASSLLVLGLHHPETDPSLDYWEGGETSGNRRLREITKRLEDWLRDEHDIIARDLPYQVSSGGVFLKDAAILAGLGVMGRSNLLINPEWGPRIRMRAMLLEAELEATSTLRDFNPCSECDDLCRNACPVSAFPEDAYERSACNVRMGRDEEREDGEQAQTISYCRLCELSCPVGK